MWDAVVAATVEHACTTHGAEVPAWTQAPERFLKRPWVYRRGPIERGTALANAPAAFIRHNTFIEPRTSTSEEESAMSGPITRARLLELFDRLNEKLRQADQQGEVYIVGGAMMVTGGRDEPAEVVLGRLEARMAESWLRAHR